MNQPSEYRSEPVKSGRDTPWRLILFAVVLVVTVLFILQNRERREIDFLFFEVRTRVWTSIIVSIVLGVLLDRLLISWWRKRKANDGR